MVKVGKPAPEFRLEGIQDVTGDYKEYGLADYRGKWVVFFFYPADFTFICPTEITGFSKHYDEFEALNAVVYGCSTDSVHSHKAWLRDLGELKTPLLSDMTHDVSAAYNVLIDDEGIALRGDRK